MENKSTPIPFDQWPWWVKVFVISSDGRILRNKPGILQPLGMYLLGTVYLYCYVGEIFKSTYAFFFYLIWMVFAQSDAAHWVIINSSIDLYERPKWYVRLMYVIPLAFVTFGIPILIFEFL